MDGRARNKKNNKWGIWRIKFIGIIRNMYTPLTSVDSSDTQVPDYNYLTFIIHSIPPRLSAVNTVPPPCSKCIWAHQLTGPLGTLLFFVIFSAHISANLPCFFRWLYHSHWDDLLQYLCIFIVKGFSFCLQL